MGKAFDPKSFLLTEGEGKTVRSYPVGETIFAEDERDDEIFYAISGQVKISRENEQGKEAIITIVDPDEFFGQECLLNGIGLRHSSATVLMPSRIATIEKEIMRRTLLAEPMFAEFFIRCLLERGERSDGDVENLLTNSMEKRLARTLLQLSRFGTPQVVKVNVTHETLAERIGTTRPMVSTLLKKFRKHGLIQCNEGIEVYQSLLDQVLNESRS